MRAAGGLRLALAPERRGGRSARFARLALIDEPEQSVRELVTDADGRLSYPLPPGTYHLRLADGQSVPFEVADERWTTVRLKLFE